MSVLVALLYSLLEPLLRADVIFTFLTTGALLYKRYQRRKYERGVAARKARANTIGEGLDARELPLESALRPYQPVPGAPTSLLMKRAPQTPLLGFKDSLGLEICVYHWPATKGYTSTQGGKRVAPRGVVILAHGLDLNVESEWSLRPGHHWEGSWIQGFCDAGFDVYGWDHHSMGRSESVCTSNLRSQCFDYFDYVDVLIQLRYLIGQRYHKENEEKGEPLLPIFLQGQSMGGLVSVLAAQKHPELFSGLSVNCPALHLEKIKKKSTNKVLLPMLRVLEFFVPHLRVAKKEPHPIQAIVAEATKLGSPMFNPGKNIPVLYAGETLRKADISMKGEHIMRLKQLPTFWAHSEVDPFVDYTGTQIVTDMLRSAKADVTLFDEFEEGAHDIVQTKDGPRVLAAVVKWMLARV